MTWDSRCGVLGAAAWAAWAAGHLLLLLLLLRQLLLQRLLLMIYIKCTVGKCLHHFAMADVCAASLWCAAGRAAGMLMPVMVTCLARYGGGVRLRWPMLTAASLLSSIIRNRIMYDLDFSCHFSL